MAVLSRRGSAVAMGEAHGKEGVNGSSPLEGLVFKVARWMGTSAEMIERHYGHRLIDSDGRELDRLDRAFDLGSSDTDAFSSSRISAILARQPAARSKQFEGLVQCWCLMNELRPSRLVGGRGITAYDSFGVKPPLFGAAPHGETC
jgi:hypothetical protein